GYASVEDVRGLAIRRWEELCRVDALPSVSSCLRGIPPKSVFIISRCGMQTEPLEEENAHFHHWN
ncbi:MAG: hypothetical protein ACUVSH_09935, partial [Anaerolineae bacterium]